MKVLSSLSARRHVYRLTLLVSAALLPGCSRSVVPAVTVSAASVRAAASSMTSRLSPEQTAIAQVQTLPLYQQAQAACQQKRYAHAAASLQQLAALKSLTPVELAFVQQQRLLCLQDAGLPVPTSAGLPAVAPASSRRLPSSAPASTSSVSSSASDADCGPRALLLLCRRLGVKTTLQTLRQKAGTTGVGTSLAGLATAAKAVGLKAEGVQVSREALGEVEGVALAYVNGSHFIALLSLQGRGESATATVHDPNTAGEETISQERLLRLCSGYLLLVKR